MQPIGPSAYRDWKPKKGPPWKIGYASSYAGNTWRANVMDRLQNTLIPKWKKLGLVSDVVITQSNLSDSLQIQQMRQLVDQGVDAIIICCSNPTALNPTAQYAHDRGVPVFSISGYITSPFAVNSSANFVLSGNMLGEWMAKEIGGKGNVLVVEGIPGTSASDSQDKGSKAALAMSPRYKGGGFASRKKCGRTKLRRPRSRSGLPPTWVELNGVIIFRMPPSREVCVRLEAARVERWSRLRSVAKLGRCVIGARIRHTSRRPYCRGPRAMRSK